MKINRIFIPMLLVSAVLLSGCGRKKEKAKTEDVAPKTVLNNQVEVEEEAESGTPDVIYYKVILKKNTLFLYEMNGENKKLITSIEINPEYYPSEDIEKLKKGIDASFKEDGYEILENFAN